MPAADFLSAWTSTAYLDGEVKEVSDQTAARLGAVVDEVATQAVAEQESDGGVILTRMLAAVDTAAEDDPAVAGLKDPDYRGLDLLTALAVVVAWGVEYAQAVEVAPTAPLLEEVFVDSFPVDASRSDLAHLDGAVGAWAAALDWIT